MITIPSLNDVSDIADSDVVMITNSQGESFKLAGSEINKRGKIIIASSTTVTGAPLKTGNSVRIYFTADLTAANASTTLQLNYNNVNYYVKAPKDGTLINFVATNLGGSPAVFKYLQKYTTLELLFDGTQFVIIGNPVILSSADYTIYADGRSIQDITVANTQTVISNTSLTDYGQYVNFEIPPKKTAVGCAFATYRLVQPSQVVVYIGSQLQSYNRINDVNSGYCSFSYYNNSNAPIRIRIAVKYMESGKTIEIGDISMRYTLF